MLVVLSQVACSTKAEYENLDLFKEPFYQGSKYDEFLIERLTKKGYIYENNEYTKNFYVDTDIYYADKKRMIFSIQKCYKYMPDNLPETLPEGLDFTERLYYNEYLYEYTFKNDQINIIMPFPENTRCFSAVVRDDDVYASCITQNTENVFVPSEYQIYKATNYEIKVIEKGSTDHVYNPPLLAKMGDNVIFTYKIIEDDYTYKGIKKILDDDTTDIIFVDKKETNKYFAEILDVGDVTILPIIYTTDKYCMMYVTNEKRENFAYIFDENGLVEEIDLQKHKKVTVSDK